MAEGDRTQRSTERRRGAALAAASAAALARLRVAGDADNARVLDLMGDVPMEGNLAIATERDPDFFALYRMQRGDNRLWVYDSEDGGPLKGMGGVLVRDGVLDGISQPVGYLGDLRTRGVLRERLAFPDVYASLFQRTVDETGCQAFLTGILADNQAALRALASSKASRSPQPHYALLRRFDMANIHFVGRLPRGERWRRRRGATVSVATDDDVPAIVKRLTDDHAARPFGWRFDDGEFEHRLKHWPGFSLANTFVARNDHGDVVGVVTCWDAAPVKRYRVQRYRGQMLWVKRALQALAAVTGNAPLPEVGAPFRYFYLTNLSVKDDDADVFAAIVDAVYAAYATAGFHFFAFPIYEGDAMASGVSGYMMRRVPFHLYAVTASSVARQSFPAGRPGFEMALA